MKKYIRELTELGDDGFAQFFEEWGDKRSLFHTGVDLSIEYKQIYRFIETLKSYKCGYEDFPHDWFYFTDKQDEIKFKKKFAQYIG